MRNKTIQQWREKGFEGFYTVKELNTLKVSRQFSSIVPATKGVYLFLRLNNTKPTFLEKGTGGGYKGKDPNVSIAELQENWVNDTPIMYIGKATKLKSRLSAYLRFGNNQSTSHWGGRLIWQLADSNDLIVCWKTTQEDPREVEKGMIQEFKKEHGGQRPFANLED